MEKGCNSLIILHAESETRACSTPTGCLAQAVPESETLPDLAFADGESAGSQTAQLLKLLDIYGASALGCAIREALERGTPRRMRLGVEGPLPLRSRGPSTPQTQQLHTYPLAYFYSATVDWFCSALDSACCC
jgi:hypothetical protein